MNNNSVVRIMGLKMRGHGVWYRIHGTRGLMENLRSGAPGSLRVMHEPWDLREGDEGRKDLRAGTFPITLRKHDGRDIAAATSSQATISPKLSAKTKPPISMSIVALRMAMVGIQAWRSCLDNGAPYEIPDFRQESVRVKYEDDNWSPWPQDQGPGQPPPSINGYNLPNDDAIAYAREVWDEMGYEGE